MIITIEMGSKDPAKQDVAPLVTMKLNGSKWQIDGSPVLTTELIWLMDTVHRASNEFKRRCKNKIVTNKKNITEGNTE